VTTRARWLWLLAIVGGVLLLVYAALPLVAGYYMVGDRRGPKIYPESYHRELFIIGWEEGHHVAQKPREPAGGFPYDRPWFYDWAHPAPEEGGG
jgi:hypothetical protein